MWHKHRDLGPNCITNCGMCGSAFPFLLQYHFHLFSVSPSVCLHVRVVFTAHQNSVSDTVCGTLADTGGATDDNFPFVSSPPSSLHPSIPPSLSLSLCFHSPRAALCLCLSSSPCPLFFVPSLLPSACSSPQIIAFLTESLSTHLSPVCLCFWLPLCKSAFSIPPCLRATSCSLSLLQYDLQTHCQVHS